MPDLEKIVIFGATGGVGRRLVAHALEREHSVTAFVRDPAKLDLEHAKLRVERGDVLDYEAVERAVQDQDAVLSALGAPPFKRDKVRSEGIRNVILAMGKAGVRRLVCLSTLGIGDSRAQLPWYLKYIVVPVVIRGVFAEHEREERLVRESALDWTLVRPGTLKNSEPTGDYRHGFPPDDRTIKATVSRGDVADFMLRQLGDETYLRKSPGVSY